MGEVLLDAFLDTLKILPFLLVMNLLIELVEHKTGGLKANGFLKGPIAPLIGTAVGVVPQCGFSVVATELYAKRKIAPGTLLAVYIATSDEAVPIMLSSYAGVTKILPVLIIKICFALIVGYAAFAVEALFFKPKASAPADGGYDREKNADASVDHCDHESEHCDIDGHGENDGPDGETQVHLHGCHSHSLEAAEPLPEDATRGQKAARIFSTYFKHPLIHTGTVLLFILIVNIVFGIIVYFAGEDNIAAFLGSTGYLQPVLAALVGLIPNCAASVVITELYVVGGLNLGGAVAGLCVSAGIGYAVLVKQNRPIKNTVLMIAINYVLAVALGMAVTALGF